MNGYTNDNLVRHREAGDWYTHVYGDCAGFDNQAIYTHVKGVSDLIAREILEGGGAKMFTLYTSWSGFKRFLQRISRYNNLKMYGKKRKPNYIRY